VRCVALRDRAAKLATFEPWAQRINALNGLTRCFDFQPPGPVDHLSGLLEHQIPGADTAAARADNTALVDAFVVVRGAKFEVYGPSSHPSRPPPGSSGIWRIGNISGDEMAVLFLLAVAGSAPKQVTAMIRSTNSIGCRGT
jgi:hypothetical protein